MEDVVIPVDSILRVLQGVAVATKAPGTLIQSLSGRLRQLEPSATRYSSIRDEGIGDRSDVCQATACKGLTFGGWHENLQTFSDPNSVGLQSLSQTVLAVSLLRERSRLDLKVSTSELDLIWSLIYQAITTADGSEVRFGVNRSAQGFMAVPLCSLIKDGHIEELWRFHTWLPDGERGLQEVSIHSHQCWAQSWILLGQGNDVTYTSRDVVDPDLATHAAYRLSWTSANGTQKGVKYTTHQQSSTISNSGRLLQLTEDTRMSHARDMSYSIPHAKFHESVIPKGRLHATLFVFDSSRGYDETAAVIGPKAGSDYTQVRDAGGITAASLAEMADATRQWEQSRGHAIEGDDEHPTVLAYYRLSRAMALLGTERSDEVPPWLKPHDGPSPLQTLAQDASPRHRRYSQQLIEAGVHTPPHSDDLYKAHIRQAGLETPEASDQLSMSA